jgi:hypothetical protein
MVYGTNFIQVETKGHCDGVQRAFYNWGATVVRAAHSGFPLTREDLGGTDKTIEVTIRTNDIPAARGVLGMMNRQALLEGSAYSMRYTFEESKRPR